MTTKSLPVRLQNGIYGKGLARLRFTSYQSSLAAWSSYATQLEDAGVVTWEDAKPYLWMAFIHGHYSDHIEKLLTDLAGDRISVKLTFESVSKHFALKRPTPHRTPPAKDQHTTRDHSTTKDQPTTKDHTTTNQTRQSNSSLCPHCNNRHGRVCWVLNPEQAPKEWLQKQVKYLSANKSTNKSTNESTNEPIESIAAYNMADTGTTLASGSDNVGRTLKPSRLIF